MTADTIVAIASPPGTGAVSLIRLSGPQAHEIGTAAFGSLPESRRVALRRVKTAEGAPLDEGVVTFYQGPGSFTGEDTVEFTGHGGVVVTRAVMERLVELGARPAGPGEFSQRSFLNGRMDLTQAEAVMDLIGAQTKLALRSANEQLQGRLGQRCEAMRASLMQTVAHLEAYLDFPEEDISPDIGEAWRKQVAAQLTEVNNLLATADQGRLLREGARTVIYGRPNVGKSSLLNRLLGFQRAIVNEREGTTRDVIEESVNVRGIPLRLIDTAGVRESEDAIEREGIALTASQVEKADLILRLRTAGESVAEAGLPDLPEGAPVIDIANKVDLLAQPLADDGTVYLSAKTGDGLTELEEKIAAVLSLDETSWGEGAVAVNVRHQACLLRAAAGLERALASLAANDEPELTAVDLYEALDAIGEIAGVVDTEDILGEIFGTFCIGK